MAAVSLDAEPTKTDLVPFAGAWAARKKDILRRSTEASAALAVAARASQANRTSVLRAPPLIARLYKTTVKVFTLRLVLATYVAIAALPSLAIALYYGLVASDQYVSEAKFAVHSGDKSFLDPISTLSAVGSLLQVQNSLVVADYIKSRAIVKALDERVGLRSMYQRREIDWISRFRSDRGLEGLSSYWRWKVKAAIEMPSGIIAVEVRAFSPEDSLKIANAVVALSEALVNGMTGRSRHDVLDQAKSELDRTQARLTEVEGALRTLRDQEGLIDPRKQAEGIGRVIEQLRLMQIRMKEDLASENFAVDAPQIKILQSHIKAMEDEIANLQQLLTNANGKTRTISSALTKFDHLELERKLAVAEYLSAAAAYEKARVNSDQQQVYLDAFVTPVLAQESLYPHRVLFSLAGVAGSHLAWLLVLGAAARLRRTLTR